jgi:hypothetical protein
MNKDLTHLPLSEGRLLLLTLHRKIDLQHIALELVC